MTKEMNELTVRLPLQVLKNLDALTSNRSLFIRDLLENVSGLSEFVDSEFIPTSALITGEQMEFMDRFDDFGFLNKTDFARYIIIHRSFNVEFDRHRIQKTDGSKVRLPLNLPIGMNKKLKILAKSARTSVGQLIRMKIFRAMEEMQPLKTKGFVDSSFSLYFTGLLQSCRQYGFYSKTDVIRTLLLKTLLDKMPNTTIEVKKEQPGPGQWVRCSTGERIFIPSRTKCISQS